VHAHLLDFADFAGAPDPSPASFSAIPSAASFSGAAASATATSAVPYTKWYNIHERHSLSDFKQEGIIFGCILVIVIVHLWGTRMNRAKANGWMKVHAPVLQREFALVGFGGRKAPTLEEVESEGLKKAAANETPVELIKEHSPSEFTSYASGRLNIAFTDIKISLLKRFNPLSVIAEFGLSFFFDSMPTPAERVDIIVYPFDGKEGLTIPGQVPGAAELRAKDAKSSYDAFVFAIVNKNSMRQLRDERYDVSITATKDSSKLPNWVTVMSESHEVTDLLLTPELAKAIEQAGDVFDHLIITDQPIDKPVKYVFWNILKLSSY
jgi:hypothetical protein